MIEQRTEAWHQQRAGRLTGSRFAAALGLCPYTSRQKLWRQLTGREPADPTNAFMQHGTTHEPIAIDWYECETGHIVTPSGFIPYGEYLGVSPDGLIGTVGAIEAKCPVSGVHESIPERYMPQCVGVLHICKREWLDFISWTDGEQRIHRITAEQTLKQWQEWRAQLEEFYEKYVLADVQPERKKRKTCTSQ